VDDDLTISTANSSDSTATLDQQSGNNAATTKTRGRRKLYTTEEQYKESKRINARNTYQRNAEKMKAARQVYKEVHREKLKEKAREKYQKDKLERADELKAKAKEKYEKKKDEAYGNSVEGSAGEDYKDIDYMVNKLAGGMNEPKKSFSGKPYRGDNPMAAGAYESRDALRASIRSELQQRLAEAKGAK
jgi:hypothetical protein